MKSDILIYQNADGNIKIDVRLEEETVWLTQDQMATLFGKGRSTVAEHIGNVFEEGELEQNRTCRKFRQVRMEGNREVEREIDHYNLDVIISVGYRVKSPQGTKFRIWATQRLKEYIIKGFSLNDDRFKSGNSMNYFNELQERIRESVFRSDSSTKNQGHLHHQYRLRSQRREDPGVFQSGSKQAPVGYQRANRG